MKYIHTRKYILLTKYKKKPRCG